MGIAVIVPLRIPAVLDTVAGDTRAALALAALLAVPGLLVLRAPYRAMPLLSLCFWVLTWTWLGGLQRSWWLRLCLVTFAAFAVLALVRLWLDGRGIWSRWWAMRCSRSPCGRSWSPRRPRAPRPWWPPRRCSRPPSRPARGRARWPSRWPPRAPRSASVIAGCPPRSQPARARRPRRRW